MGAHGEARGVGRDGARDVEPGGELESLEAGTGVHLEDFRSAVPFEEVHAGDVEPEYARRANGGLRGPGRDVDRHPLRAAVDVAAELALLRLPPHGADYALPHDEGAHVPSPRLGDELLQEDLVPEVPHGGQDALHLGGTV